MVESNEHALNFDALAGGSEPSTLLGVLLNPSESHAKREALKTHSDIAVARVHEDFKVRITFDQGGMDRLDAIIREIWADEWSPEVGDIRLFTMDLGSLLAEALIRLPGAVPVFRVPRVFFDMSVWFPAPRIEYFPLHKVGKALAGAESESVAQLFRSAARLSADPLGGASFSRPDSPPA